MNELGNEPVKLGAENYSSIRVTVNSETREKKGGMAIAVSEEKQNKIVEFLEKLEPIVESDAKETLKSYVGGRYVIYVFKDERIVERYVLHTENIIEYRGEFYKDSSGVFEKLEKAVIEALPANSESADMKAYDTETVFVIASIRESMGEEATKLNDKEKNEVLSLLGELELCEIEKPEAKDIPIGGSSNIYCYKDDTLVEKYEILSKELIIYNGGYYKDISTTDSFENLETMLIEL